MAGRVIYPHKLASFFFPNCKRGSVRVISEGRVNKRKSSTSQETGPQRQLKQPNTSLKGNKFKQENIVDFFPRLILSFKPTTLGFSWNSPPYVQFVYFIVTQSHVLFCRVARSNMSIYLSLIISNHLARKALLHLTDSTKEKNECFRLNLFHARNNRQFPTNWVERSEKQVTVFPLFSSDIVKHLTTRRSLLKNSFNII